jgi:hypothetical protein
MEQLPTYCAPSETCMEHCPLLGELRKAGAETAAIQGITRAIADRLRHTKPCETDGPMPMKQPYQGDVCGMHYRYGMVDGVTGAAAVVGMGWRPPAQEHVPDTAAEICQPLTEGV